MEIFGIGLLLFWLVMIVASLAASAFWVWMLIDCAMNEPNIGNDKLIWILIIVFTSWVGAAIYYFVRRPERIRDFGQ